MAPSQSSSNGATAKRPLANGIDLSERPKKKIHTTAKSIYQSNSTDTLSAVNGRHVGCKATGSEAPVDQNNNHSTGKSNDSKLVSSVKPSNETISNTRSGDQPSAARQTGVSSLGNQQPKKRDAISGEQPDSLQASDGAQSTPLVQSLDMIKIWVSDQAPETIPNTESSDNERLEYEAIPKRQHNHPVMLFNIRTRACNDLKLPPLGQWPFRLSISANGEPRVRKEINQVYIGVSSINLQAVFLMPDDSSDSSFLLKTGPGLVACNMRDTILHEFCTVPGNLLRLVSFLNHDKVTLRGCPDPVTSIPLDHGRWSRGLSIDPPFHQHPGHRRPRLGINPKEENKSQWTLKWPPLGVLGISLEMVSILNAFLDKHLMDPIPINLAVATTIIYFDMEARG